MGKLPKPYYQDDACTIYHGDCRDILPLLPKVDLVLTSPPYDNMRDYGASFVSFPWEQFISPIKAALESDGMLVWNVACQHVEGGRLETLFGRPLRLWRRV